MRLQVVLKSLFKAAEVKASRLRPIQIQKMIKNTPKVSRNYRLSYRKTKVLLDALLLNSTALTVKLITAKKVKVTSNLSKDSKPVIITLQILKSLNSYSDELKILETTVPVSKEA